MFADSLLETSWTQPSRRGWTMLSSLGLQIVAAGILLLVPLFRPSSLPFVQRLSTPIALAASPGPPPGGPVRHAASASPATSQTIVAPAEVPRSIVADDGPASAPPQLDTSGWLNRDGAGGGGDPRGIPGLDSIPGNGVLPPPPPRPVSRPPRVSQVMEGNLIQRVEPEYPPLARTARIQGQVVLQAVISREGVIENLRVLSGHFMLVRAAVEAVSHWRYRPYYLNNEPVEVETQITVNFTLSEG
jgi:protein TonB